MARATVSSCGPDLTTFDSARICSQASLPSWMSSSVEKAFSDRRPVTGAVWQAAMATPTSRRPRRMK
jgi:hypothetical protein